MFWNRKSSGKRKSKKGKRGEKGKQRATRKAVKQARILAIKRDRADFRLPGYIDESGDAKGEISPIDVSSQDEKKPSSFVMARARQQLQTRRSRSLWQKLFPGNYYPGSYPMLATVRDDIDNDTRGSTGATCEWLRRHCPNRSTYQALIADGGNTGEEELIVRGTEPFKDVWEQDRAHWQRLIPVRPSDRSPSPYRKAMDKIMPDEFDANNERVRDYLRQESGIVPTERMDKHRASVTTMSSYEYPSDLESASTFINSSGDDEWEWNEMNLDYSLDIGGWSVSLLSIRDLHDYFLSEDENNREIFAPGNAPSAAPERKRVSRSVSLDGRRGQVADLDNRDRSYVMGRKDFDQLFKVTRPSRRDVSRHFDLHSVQGRICTTRPVNRLEPLGIKWIKKHQGVTILDKYEYRMIPGRGKSPSKKEIRAKRKKRRELRARLRRNESISDNNSDAASQLQQMPIITKFF